MTQPLSEEALACTYGGWAWVPFAVGTGIILDFLHGVHDGIHDACEP